MRRTALISGLIILLMGCTAIKGVKAPPTPVGRETLISEEGRSIGAEVPEGYFVGISKDYKMDQSARDDALLNARKQIIESLGLKLESEVVDRILTRGDTRGVLTSDVMTDAKINAVAKNILMVRAERWYIRRWERTTKGGVEYFFRARCLVEFDREAHDRFVHEMVTQSEKLAQPVFEEGVRLEGGGQLHQAVGRYLKVVEVVRELDEFTGIPPDWTTGVRKLKIDAEGRLEGLFGRIRFSTFNDNQVGVVGKGLKNPLLLVVTVTQRGGETPLEGFPVTFRFVEGVGRLDEGVTTDGKGVAASRVYRIDSRKDRNLVEAVVGGADLEGVVSFPLPKATFSFRSTFAAEATLVSVSIEETILGERVAESRVQSRVIDALRKKGFQVLDLGERPGEEPDIVVTGAARADKADELVYDNKTYGIYFCRARINLEAKNTRDGSILATMDERVKGSGADGQKAAQSALTAKNLEGILNEFVKKIEASLE